jgi:hypothetical protein
MLDQGLGLPMPAEADTCQICFLPKLLQADCRKNQQLSQASFMNKLSGLIPTIVDKAFKDGFNLFSVDGSCKYEL